MPACISAICSLMIEVGAVSWHPFKKLEAKSETVGLKFALQSALLPGQKSGLLGYGLADHDDKIAYIMDLQALLHLSMRPGFIALCEHMSSLMGMLRQQMPAF